MKYSFIHNLALCSVMSDSLQPPALAHQAPLSVGFPRQKYWSQLPFPTPGDLLDPGIKPASLVSPALAGRYFTTQFSSVSSGAQLSLTLCNPVDCSPPGSSVCGIFQSRTLEWFAIPFSRGSSPPRDRTQISYITGRFFTT